MLLKSIFVVAAKNAFTAQRPVVCCPKMVYSGDLTQKGNTIVP